MPEGPRQRRSVAARYAAPEDSGRRRDATGSGSALVAVVVAAGTGAAVAQWTLALELLDDHCSRTARAIANHPINSSNPK